MKYNDYLFYNELTISYNDFRDIVNNENYSNATTSSISYDEVPSAGITISLLDEIQTAVVMTSIVDSNLVYGQLDLAKISNGSGISTLVISDVTPAGETKTINISTLGGLRNIEF
jgi:hypothetical protein